MSMAAKKQEPAQWEEGTVEEQDTDSSSTTPLLLWSPHSQLDDVRNSNMPPQTHTDKEAVTTQSWEPSHQLPATTTTTQRSLPDQEEELPEAAPGTITATWNTTTTATSCATTRPPKQPSSQPPPTVYRHNVILPMNHSYSFHELIDNRTLTYVSIRLRRSKVSVQVRPAVLARCPAVLLELDQDLHQCLTTVLPPSVQGLVQRTVVWIHDTYVYGPRQAPIVLDHTTAHHHPAWLQRVGDCAEKVLGIEIYNCFAYRRMRMHWNGCGLILHELCHLIHQQVLPHGLDNGDVKRCYQRAQSAFMVGVPSQYPNLYQETLRRDWAGKRVERDLHYGMVNDKEFFAELSVTYLATGYAWLDQVPLRRRRRQGDHSSLNSVVACSPPLMEPTVVARLQQETVPNQQQQSYPPPWYGSPAFGVHTMTTHHHRPVPHCNKFYPFTRGQLRHYDPPMYHAFEYIWKTVIAQWRDPQEPTHEKDNDSSSSSSRCDLCCCGCSCRSQSRPLGRRRGGCWWTPPWSPLHKVNVVS